MTDIELRYFDSCPNWKIAEQRLQEAIEVEHVDCSITYTEVQTPEDAERLDFVGSPTILIDGLDPFRSDGAKPGLACRIFATEAGPQGAPCLNELRSLLRNRRGSSGRG